VAGLSFEKYDKKRSFEDKSVQSACYAPHVSVFFDTLGQVRACCLNHTYPLGHLGGQTFDEIWNGENIRQLRHALENYDFGLGCDFCQWQVADEHGQPHTLKYDPYPVDTSGPLWPANMEFNLSNACNLECVMCNGEWSSAIRSHREHLPPLKKYYDDRFFDQLRKYLPHVRAAQFLGGEPFLVPEHQRVWDMMIEQKANTFCQITTNGTQYNDRVIRILEALPCSITISFDGVTPQTFETIRVNARFDQVIENFHRFQEYSRQHGRTVSFNFSLMTLNWHEFADFLLFAEEYSCPVNVCTVVSPSKYSLFMIPVEQLKPIVAHLDSIEQRIADQLVVNRKAWIDTIDRLRNRIKNDAEGNTDFVPSGFFESFRSLDRTPLTDEQALAMLRDWSNEPSSTLLADHQDTVTEVPTGAFLVVPAEQCVGRPIDAVLSVVRVNLGPMVNILRWESHPNYIDRIIAFRTPMLDVTYVRLLIRPVADPAGKQIAVRIDAARTNRLPTT
jgi:MoaA/NifB/PqqE/SkfB family radical SAM enzyme